MKKLGKRTKLKLSGNRETYIMKKLFQFTKANIEKRYMLMDILSDLSQTKNIIYVSPFLWEDGVKFARKLIGHLRVDIGEKILQQSENILYSIGLGCLVPHRIEISPSKGWL